MFNSSREEPSPAGPPCLLHHLMPSMEPSSFSLCSLWDLVSHTAQLLQSLLPFHPTNMLYQCQRPLRIHSIRTQQEDSFQVSPKWDRQSSVPLPPPCGDNNLCTAGVHICFSVSAFAQLFSLVHLTQNCPFLASKDPAQHITKCISDLAIIIRCPDTGSWSTGDLVCLKTTTTLLGLCST